MKVRIGPYLNWVGPYQIVDKIFFWIDKYPLDQSLYNRWDYKLHDRLGDWLAETWVADFCQWIYSKRKRTIKVRIDPYDVWSFDHTLSMIIYPALVKLKEQKHGYFLVDDDDVPEELRSHNGTIDKDYNWDSLAEARCNYLFDELIWTFKQISSDNDEEEFYDHSEMNLKDDITLQIKQLKVDREGLQKHWDRIKNGTRLFGKYYQNLWD